MSQEERVVHCRLMKPHKSGHPGLAEWTITYVPEEYAHIGNHVKIKIEVGNKKWTEWDAGWIIESADLDHPISKKYIEERSEDYKRTRRASDV